VVVKLLSENFGYMLMVCYAERTVPLEPGERESVPIWRIQTGLLDLTQRPKREGASVICTCHYNSSL
jgi:hypothetical protein